MNILAVFGTRPEAIKMAPLIKEMQKDSFFQLSVCVTGQHRRMLDQVMNIFDIRPDFDLNVMQPNQDLFDISASILVGMRGVINDVRPDLLLTHGDTTTTLASSLAAFYLGVPVGHVEAGLRTSDIKMPFPEEFNRQVVTKLASIHFAPTRLNAINLIKEGVNESNIIVTGNTVIDALFMALEEINSSNFKSHKLTSSLNKRLPFEWKLKKFVLITGHRRENFGDGIHAICRAIKNASEDMPDIHFVYPVHLNPNIISVARRELSFRQNIHLIEPLEYEEFIFLLKHAHLVLTDSGGIQEEAPSLGIPVLVMRESTERPEAVAAGVAKIVGASSENIHKNLIELLSNEYEYKKMTKIVNPYGDGFSSSRILKALKMFHKNGHAGGNN